MIYRHTMIQNRCDAQTCWAPLLSQLSQNGGGRPAKPRGEAQSSEMVVFVRRHRYDSRRKWVESAWSGLVEETGCIRKTPAGADLHQHLQGGDCIARRGGKRVRSRARLNRKTGSEQGPTRLGALSTASSSCSTTFSCSSCRTRRHSDRNKGGTRASQ